MKTKVLVVDDNENIINMISDYFEGNGSIEVLFKASDGEEAIKIIKDNSDSIDIILLDIIMSKKDGLGVLEYLKDNNINISVIVMSSFNEESVIRNTSEYGVKYFMLKPFDLVDLEKRINNIVSIKELNNDVIDFATKDILMKVTKLLHALGIPSHIKGYELIRTGIIMVYENPRFIGGITKELYPDLSAKYNTSVQRVERAIRHAIEVSWLRGDIELMEEIFGHSVDIDRAKPTNSEFIVTIADKLRLEMIDIK